MGDVRLEAIAWAAGCRSSGCSRTRVQRVVRAFHTPQELAVRDARPATAAHRIDTVALERRGEV